MMTLSSLRSRLFVGGIKLCRVPTHCRPFSTTTPDIQFENANGVQLVMLTRPEKKNSITIDMYSKIKDCLNESAQDPSVRCALITASGDWFSSGNDLSNFLKPGQSPKDVAAASKVVLSDFVEAFIKYPKPIVAGVNGPAIGISVTMLALCDLVHASDTATFRTPFSSLAQGPEACSSYLLPRIMGLQRANEMLLLGREFSAEEMRQAGVVSDVHSHDELHRCVSRVAGTLASFPPIALQESKRITREFLQPTLMDVNRRECENLEERWSSEECAAAISAFMKRKK